MKVRDLFWLQLYPKNALHAHYAVGLFADIAQHTSESIVVIKVAKSDLGTVTFKYTWRVCSGFPAAHTLGSSSYAK
ncbi:uncharacterized protein ARMOST_16416 [Armillaria ostoyae]|uniref:Uncharacterized protein n=1 Tax=Armillaria ostoyae TaxID=47428 RepID=A0A284RW63_ARMOS|nr:uncharacterized protein ARMOST_16416 [Armillaria ostoyae]